LLRPSLSLSPSFSVSVSPSPSLTFSRTAWHILLSLQLANPPKSRR
jgi:hypothetical protein